MSKKVNVAGESYIVSEDVDFEKLDTDNMVEKDAVAELIATAKTTSETLRKSIENKTREQEAFPVKRTLQTKRPILEFHLKFARKHYVFSGEIFWAEVLELSSNYKLIMKTGDALKLHYLMLKSQGKVSSSSKLVLYLKSIIYQDNEEPIEFLPPKGKNGITAQKLDRVKFSSKASTKRSENSYVEIEFVSIHWR